MSNDLPLSQQLEKMGFDRSTFMVVDKFEKVIVGDRRGNDFVENPAATFGNVYKQVDNGQYKTTFEINDEAMLNAKGGIGSNNGVYSAQMKGGHELIITQDREIYEALQKMGYNDCIGVPMSNGGDIKDWGQQMSYNDMKVACKAKNDRAGEKDRTAAVQRGDIITTYDPNNIDSDGCFRNVRHYEQQEDGGLKPVIKEYASAKLHLKMHYSSDEIAEINKGQKLDSQVVSKMIQDKAKYY